MTWINKSFQITFDVHATSIRCFFTEILYNFGIFWNTPPTLKILSSINRVKCYISLLQIVKQFQNAIFQKT
jgi:hypothetical protein